MYARPENVQASFAKFLRSFLRGVKRRVSAQVEEDETGATRWRRIADAQMAWTKPP